MEKEVYLIIDNFIEYMMEPVEEFDDVKNDMTVFQQSEIFELMSYCDKNRESVDEVLALVTKEIGKMDVFKASLCCIMCGTWVEYGGSAAIIVNGVVMALYKSLKLLAEYFKAVEAGKSDPEIFKQDADAYKAFKGIDFIVLPAMTMLCRDVKARQMFKVMPHVKSLVEEHVDKVYNLYYLSKLFNLSDDVSMILIHPGLRKGFAVKLNAIQNNFHLFTLLQNEMYEKGLMTELGIDSYKPHKNAIMIAKGQKALRKGEVITDEVVLDLFIWPALDEQGKIKKEFPLDWWIPGELLPMNIPELDGTKVVFFDTKRMKAREWDASFFQSLHEALCPEVRLERELTPEEVDTWIQKVLAEIPRQQSSEIKHKEEPRGWKGFLDKIFRK